MLIMIKDVTVPLPHLEKAMILHVLVVILCEMVVSSLSATDAAIPLLPY